MPSFSRLVASWVFRTTASNSSSFSVSLSAGSYSGSSPANTAHDSQKLLSLISGTSTYSTLLANRRMFHIFVLLVGVTIEVLMCFWPNVIAGIQSCGLKLMHGLLYVYYAFSFAVRFRAFTDANRGLISSCHYVLQGAGSVNSTWILWWWPGWASATVRW